MRRVATIALVTAALAAGAGVSSAQLTGIRGDVTGDDKVGAVDAQAVLVHVVGGTTPGTFVPAKGDANGDGTVTALDAQIILAYAVGLDVSQFPVGKPFGPTVAQITISPPGGTILTGLTLQLTAVLRDSRGAVLTGHVVTWSSSDSTRATVSSSGLVLGRSAGQATVTASSEGVSATVTVTVETINLTIAGLYLTQAAQRFDGSTPLIAGRAARIRVFGRASSVNPLRPGVRVRVYHGGALTRTFNIAASDSGVPVGDDVPWSAPSWDVLLPAADVRAGLALTAEIDPDRRVAETDETDNLFPGGGGRHAPDLRAVPAFQVRFVPIHVSGGRTGTASPAAAEQMLSLTRRLHPILAYEFDIRAPYTTSATYVPDDSPDAWQRTLSEVEALRALEGSARYYYGLLDVDGPAFGGLAYLPGRAGIGLDINWDSKGEIYAHEIGHNFARPHAPCDVGDADPSYPYPNADIGVTGWDQATNSLIPPTHKDLMSYCDPKWTSDYTWVQVMNHRGSTPAGSPAAAAMMAAMTATREPTLLLWGRIGARGAVLEPAFDVVTRPVMPDAPGPYRLTGLDAAGAVIFSFTFAGQEIDHLPRERHFAFAMPIAAIDRERLATIRLSAAGTESVRSIADVETSAEPMVRLLGRDDVEIRWNAQASPVLLVRDAATGDVLSFARGGRVRLRAAARALDVQSSDGVRSRSTRKPVTPE